MVTHLCCNSTVCTAEGSVLSVADGAKKVKSHVMQVAPCSQPLISNNMRFMYFKILQCLIVFHMVGYMKSVLWALIYPVMRLSCLGDLLT